MVSKKSDPYLFGVDLLQWSHVFSDMVRAGDRCVDDRGILASMEPCLFRHGKVDGQTPVCWRGIELQWSHVFSDMVSIPGRPVGRRNDQASMEPCLFRHGKDKFRTHRPKSGAASMEPCLFRHGKKCPVCGKYRVKMLQWSHVFSDMVSLLCLRTIL